MNKTKTVTLYSNTASGRTFEEVTKRVTKAMDHLATKYVGLPIAIHISFGEEGEAAAAAAAEIAEIIKPAKKKTVKKTVAKKAVKKTVAKKAAKKVVSITLDPKDPNPKKTVAIVKERVAKTVPGAKVVVKKTAKKAAVKKVVKKAVKV